MGTTEIVAISFASALAAFGWMIKAAVESVNARLDRLELKLGEIVSQVNVSVARQDVNTIEIDKLRVKVHSIESEVTALDAIQQRCRHCTPKS